MVCWLVAGLALCGGAAGETAAQERPPNILIAISDDQSFPHASAYGAPWVQTPAFERVARGGVLFTQAFVASPGCSPSRAALLTGRYPWQLELAGTHASAFPTKYVVFPDLLEEATEVEWFDRPLARMLALLEAAGELDSTIVVITSDNGMAFPRAKANGDVRRGPDCLNNLADDSPYDGVTETLRAQLEAYLLETEDPRVRGTGDVFETYERFSGAIRTFPPPEWALP